MTPRDLTALLLLSALWGGSFVFMRVAAPVLGPILLVELRVLIAGVTLLAFALLTRSLPPVRTHWKEFLVIGTINSALPFVLASAATVHITASLAVTLNATTPLFAALVGAVWQGQRLTRGKLGGLLLGLLGVMILVGFGPVELTLVVGLAIGASLLAALSYGVAVVYTKTQGTGVQPFALALYSQLFAALVLLPAVPFALPSSSPSGVVMGAVVALGVLCTAVAYLLYFGLIQRVELTKATMVTYLSPAFGILWGALLLREPLTVWTFVGFGLILLSVAFITGVRVGRLPVRKPTRA